MNAMTGKQAQIDEIIGQWPTIDATPRFSVAGGPSALLHHLLTWLRECHERSRQRTHLQMLDERLLQDIGVSAAEVGAELAKWPWVK